MPIFKVGDEILSFDDEGQDLRAIYEIKHIVNPDGEHCTLACQNGDDWYYFKLDEVVQYKSAFTKSEHPEKVNTANDVQVGGSHYQKSIQPWDYIIANNLGYLEGNIIKYVSRYKEKNGKQDLEKAKHYLDKLIESLGE